MSEELRRLLLSSRTLTEDIEDRMSKLSCAEATALYAEICAATTAFLHTGRGALFGRYDKTDFFVRAFVNQSKFMDHLQDSMHVPPQERRALWAATASREQVAAQAQRIAASRVREESERRLRARRLNAAAYRATRLRIRLGFQHEPAVVRYSNAELVEKTPSFWYALSFSQLSTRRRRAVIHRIKLFMDEYGAVAVPSAIRDRLDG